MNLPPRAAAIRGDDLQHAIGWFWACQMLTDPDIESVSIEDAGGGHFDDIVVRRCSAASLFIQAKSSNNAGTVVDEKWLTSPATSGGKSPLAHFYGTYVDLAAGGEDFELELATTRPFDPAHPLLGTLRDSKHERIDVDAVAAAGRRSKAGKARDAWLSHLGVDIDDLLGFLGAVTWSHCQPEPKWLSHSKPYMELAGLRSDDPAPLVGARIVHDWVTDGRGPRTADDLRLSVGDAGLLATKGTLVLQVDGIDREPQPVLPNVTLDFVDLYEGADSFSRKLLADAANWDAVVLPAFADAARTLGAYRVRHVHITGALRHPMWFAAGRALPEVKKWTLSMDQVAGTWRTDNAPAEVEPRVLADVPLDQGTDLAVGIGLTSDLSEDVVRYVCEAGVPVGRVFVLGPPGDPSPTAVPDGGWAVGWTRAAREAIRAAVADAGAARVHVFTACPAGIVLMLGHQWNMLPPTTLYEFAGTYFPTATFEGA